MLFSWVAGARTPAPGYLIRSVEDFHGAGRQGNLGSSRAPPSVNHRDRSAVTMGEEVLRARLERFGRRYEEPEGVSQRVHCVEREGDGERVLDLLA